MAYGPENAAAPEHATIVAAVTGDASPNVRRGWIYRVLGCGSESRVLAIGDLDLAPWFESVATASVLAAPTGGEPQFDLVVLHATLGRCASMEEALRRAAAQTARGGIVALAGANVLRASGTRATAPAAPPASYRRAALRAGLRDVATYMVRPDLQDPAWIVDTSPDSAVPFFGNDAATARAGGRPLAGALGATLARAGAAILLERWLLVAGRVC